MDDRIIFHVDVNNAFLSWSAVKLLNEGYPIDIRTIPSVIGGKESKRHGVVLAKSPVAKKLGIESAESLYSARKKCKFLKIYPADFEFYKIKSIELFKYLSKYTPDIEVFSIDECYMDMSNMSIIYNDFEELAYKIRDEIYKKFGYTVNVGIGNNKLCAKMASDFEKPNKVNTLYNYEIQSKLWSLDISNLMMVGKNMTYKLKEYGINTIGELAKSDRLFLKRKFKSYGVLIWQYANGIDDSKVVCSRKGFKSISVSETLEKDTSDIRTLKRILLKQSSVLGERLRKQKKFSLMVGITIKYDNFFEISKQKKLLNPICFDLEIYNNVLKLFEENWNYEKIRSIGIYLANFINNRCEQISIFDDNNKLKDIDFALDKIKSKYGNKIIIQAGLLLKDK